jgi:hypothetical protein
MGLSLSSTARVEFVSILVVIKIPALRLSSQPYFTYFIPLFLGLPFLAGVQTYRRINRSLALFGADRNTFAPVCYSLLATLIWSYVGFVVILGFLVNALH